MPDDLFNRMKSVLFRRGTLPPRGFYDLKESILEKKDEIWKDPLPHKGVTLLGGGSWTKTDEKDYLPVKYPKYILTKSHLLSGQEEVKKIGALHQPKQIERK